MKDHHIAMDSATPGVRPACRASGVSDENPGLAPPSLSAFLWHKRLPVQVSCCIPAYRQMARGDRITLRWGDEKFDLPPLRGADLGRALVVAVPRPVLASIRKGDHLEISYCIIDAGGKRSGWARPCVVKVRAAGSGVTYVYAAD